uniref:(northern house mosquito) hypothetical protein n=1 Tax=Culex pipiens TaxID=7175 RepID=A0A8D8BUU1_CULPI
MILDDGRHGSGGKAGRRRNRRSRTARRKWRRRNVRRNVSARAKLQLLVVGVAILRVLGLGHPVRIVVASRSEPPGLVRMRIHTPGQNDGASTYDSCGAKIHNTREYRGVALALCRRKKQNGADEKNFQLILKRSFNPQNRLKTQNLHISRKTHLLNFTVK